MTVRRPKKEDFVFSSLIFDIIWLTVPAQALFTLTRVMEPLCCNPDPNRTVTDIGSPLGNIMRKRHENCISMNSPTVSFRQKI